MGSSVGVTKNIQKQDSVLNEDYAYIARHIPDDASHMVSHRRARDQMIHVIIPLTSWDYILKEIGLPLLFMWVILSPHSYSNFE